MANDEVIAEVMDDVGVITLNRPRRRNAISESVYRRMRDAVREFDADRGVRAILLTGSGPAFCSGADVREQFEAHLETGGRVPDWADWPGLIRSVKPTLAALNGPAVGLGVSLILPFDRIIVTPDVCLTLGFIKFGLVPEMGASNYLPRRVGFAVASDLLLTGRTVDSIEAVRIGLADELVESESLMTAALARSREFGAGPSTHLRWIKRLLDANSCEGDLEVTQLRETAALRRSLRTDEHAEAVRAFLEKRQPDFS